jgi:hypothetical protein
MQARRNLFVTLLLLLSPACVGDDLGPEPGEPHGSGSGSDSHPGSGSGSGTGSGDEGGPGEPSGPLRVFASRGVYAGDLIHHVAAASDGLAAADAICQLRADAAELGGTWVAWLSSSEVDAIDRISGQGPWALLDGTVVFHNRAQLQTEPLGALDRDEFGKRQDDCFCGRVYVWTGTRAGGFRHENTCGDWTSRQDVGRHGMSQPAPSFAWTDYANDRCTDGKRLLCLEQ